jgi:small subunit ribosomal protein S17
MARNIGLEVKPPEQECTDKNCPFHGVLPVRGQILEGIVVSDKMDKTVVVQQEYLKYISKYERYERRRSKIHAHNPPCINARIGDFVKIAECRPLSKTKAFVVIEKVERK